MNAFVDVVFVLATLLLAVLMLQTGHYMTQSPDLYPFWMAATPVVLAMLCVAALVLHVWNGGLP